MQRLETGVICHIKDSDSSRPIVPLRQGVLLYGPPGNGKTTLVTALAYHCQATCYQVDAATLTDPYHGNDSKLVRILFEEARHHQPAIIFIGVHSSAILTCCYSCASFASLLSVWV